MKDEFEVEVDLKKVQQVVVIKRFLDRRSSSRSAGVRCVKADILFMFVYDLDSLLVALSRQGAADVLYIKSEYDEERKQLLFRVQDNAANKVGGDGDEDFVIGEGVVVSSSSLVKSTKSFLGGMMVSLTFLEGLEEEATVEAMEVEEK
ncbi:hypothetical protein Tco_0545805 [Tanacetum coccineum]